MISAEEAKKLYNASSAEVDEYFLKTIEPAIIETAKAGIREVSIYIDCIRSNTSYVVKPLDANVLAKLRNLGYVAGIQWIGSEYVPRGLQDDSGEGPKYRNYGYVIKWY